MALGLRHSQPRFICTVVFAVDTVKFGRCVQDCGGYLMPPRSEQKRRE